MGSVKAERTNAGAPKTSKTAKGDQVMVSSPLTLLVEVGRLLPFFTGLCTVYILCRLGQRGQ